MTRVVAGRWRGRRLRVPPAGTRPTADRVREAVFSRLDHELGQWDGLAVLDLYAGSGALGIEALSRGAARVTFVESDRAAAAVLRANLAALAAPEATLLVATTAAVARRPPAGGPYDVVLADPPYDLAPGRVAGVLAALWAGGWLAPGAEVVVETARRTEGSPWPAGFTPVAERDYGETRVWYGRARRPDDH